MNLWIKVGVIAAGGAAGALTRAFASELVVSLLSPRLNAALALATLSVNVVGCLLFGAARGAVDAMGWGSPELRLLVFAGFLGAFTTFSTFEADMVGLWTSGERAGAIAYLAASVLLGLGAFVLGWWAVTRAYA